mgnify:CR=1 FL=1
MKTERRVCLFVVPPVPVSQPVPKTVFRSFSRSDSGFDLAADFDSGFDLDYFCLGERTSKAACGTLFAANCVASGTRCCSFLHPICACVQGRTLNFLHAVHGPNGI